MIYWDHLMTLWTSHLSTKGKKIGMSEMFQRLGLDIIAKVVFGLDTNAIKENSVLRSALDDVLGGVSANYENPLIQYLPTYRAIWRRVDKGCELLRKVGRDCIVQHQNVIRERGEYGNDILGCILKCAADDKDLVIDDLVDEFVTLFFAGHDTTSVTMAFALQAVLLDTAIKKRVTDEVDDVLNGRNHVLATDLSSLSLVGCVFKETLRCYPPVPALIRSPTSDMTVCGYNIPSGTKMNISIDAIHKRPDYWSNPLEFNPDRFLTSSTEGPLAFFPFSAGPRICLVNCLLR